MPSDPCVNVITTARSVNATPPTATIWLSKLAACSVPSIQSASPVAAPNIAGKIVRPRQLARKASSANAVSSAPGGSQLDAATWGGGTGSLAGMRQREDYVTPRICAPDPKRAQKRRASIRRFCEREGRAC
jgi:hypothetical protein